MTEISSRLGGTHSRDHEAAAEATITDAAELCELYAPRVYRFAAMVSRGEVEADDLAQDALERAIRRLGTFDPARGTIDACLWRSLSARPLTPGVWRSAATSLSNGFARLPSAPRQQGPVLHCPFPAVSCWTPLGGLARATAPSWRCVLVPDSNTRKSAPRSG